MPPTSLLSMLAFGLVGIVGAGLVILATHYAGQEDQRERQHRSSSDSNHQNRRTPKRRQGSHERVDGLCFCSDDEFPTNVYLETCGHSFHKTCILQWAQDCPSSRNVHGCNYPTCPNCREPFNLPFDVKHAF